MNRDKLFFIIKIIFIATILALIPLKLMLPEKDLTSLILIFEKFN